MGFVDVITSQVADAEKTEPAQEVPGDADTKAPASAEGVETTDTDQPAVPAPGKI